MHILSAPFIGLVRIYQYFISPLFPASCRFHPTCSSYAIQAYRRFGPIFGTFLALRRIARCHPWGGCGEDPVPDSLNEIWTGRAQRDIAETR